MRRQLIQPNAADQQDQPIKRFQLKWRMLKLFCVCWVLPVVLITVFGGMYLFQSITEHAKQRLQQSVDSALYMTHIRMEDALDASRAASYVGTVREAWHKYAADGDQVKLYESSRSFLNRQYQYDDHFKSTILAFLEMPKSPLYVINAAAGGTDRIRHDADAILQMAIAESETLDTGIAYFKVGERVFMMRNLVDAKYQPIAVLLMELNVEQLFAEFSQISNLELGKVTLGDVSLTLNPVHPPEIDRPTRTEDELRPAPEGVEGLFITYEDWSMYTTVQDVEPDYTFTYHGITYPAILREQFVLSVAILSAVLLLMLPLGAVMLGVFFKYVTYPLSAMVAMADEIRAERYGVRLPEHLLQSHEIGLLGDTFNSMSMTLQEQFEHIYKEQIALRDAKIMALQSQINPHFLNNTLEIINWEARMQGDLKVCNMLESLSTMLNAAMDRRNRPTVHLSEELMYVDAYLYIINERLGKRLVFEKDIPDELLDCTVPRLILQPILENAVNHGITPVQRGRIVLRATVTDGWLILSVENDGQLKSEDKARIELILSDDYTPDTLSSGSLGLRNVHQRLRILYGEEGGVLVDITKKNLTIVKLKVKL